MADVAIVGRSSSLFTRVARIFAGELGVAYTFDVVPDLGSRQPDDYAGNPALKIPVLRRSGELVFGTLNICRTLAEKAPPGSTRPVWPEDLDRIPLRNAHELTQAAMTTEVSLIMAQHAGVSRDNDYCLKMRDSLGGTLAWLDELAKAEATNLPTRDRLSYLEVSLYCLVAHIEFRGILDVSPYAAIRAFRDQFGERAAARRTSFKFDDVSVHR
ncbi:MAG TPA: glutathione S-transferase family protein [Polyangia bacterium]|nr:glutathione S-transferase family protein [Polyangia bacterium]